MTIEMRWERLDKMIDEQIRFNKEQAAKGLHNYGICQLCHRTHYVETEPNLNKEGDQDGDKGHSM